MKVTYTKQFLKGYTKLSVRQRQRTDERILLWQADPSHPLLRDHQLVGNFANYRSINISGDIRALYFEEEQLIVFDLIGTHSQIYG